jgi:hypothetical protein
MTALDRLPLEVLLALQDAVVAPGPLGAERARKRAEDAGFYLVAMGEVIQLDDTPLPLPSTTVPMEEAPEETLEEAVHLAFGDRPGPGARRDSVIG